MYRHLRTRTACRMLFFLLAGRGVDAGLWRRDRAIKGTSAWRRLVNSYGNHSDLMLCHLQGEELTLDYGVEAKSEKEARAEVSS